jgi:hypothetical protein
MKLDRRQLLGVLALLVLSGCATPPQPLYYWGDYQDQLYGHFKGVKSPEEQIARLEADVEKAASNNMALPPGFQAHLAILYGSTGNTEKMRNHLEAEKQQFPESSVFMDFLLKKFEHKDAR